MPELDLYQAQVRIDGSNVWTAVYAESASDARELLEAVYGEDAVVARPRKVG